jgi:hypothetical protein
MAEAADAVRKRTVAGRTNETSVKEEFEDTMLEYTEEFLETALGPETSEVLYCLYVASDHTEERIGPERLIELAGLYHTPYSLDSIEAAIGRLKDHAFAYKREDGTVDLTDSGLIVARFLGRLIKDESLYKTLQLDEATYADLRERLQKVDRIFQRGV